MQMKESLVSKQHSRSILLSYENGWSNIPELSTSQCKRSSERVLQLLQLNVLLHSRDITSASLYCWEGSVGRRPDPQSDDNDSDSRNQVQQNRYGTLPEIPQTRLVKSTTSI